MYATAHSAEITMGPVNPEFTDFMLRGPQLRAAYSESAGTGYIPSPMDRSHLKGNEYQTFQRLGTALPSSYDLRILGRVTPVRNQGSCGSCWAFGAMAALESALLPGETRDFSENNLKNNHGFDWGPCSGGNVDISTAYLMRLSGPVNEVDDPYRADLTPSPAGLTAKKHVQNIIHLPPRTSSTSNDDIKNAVMNYGAVTVSYYENSAYYNAANKAYYYSGTSSSNHEVAIVGWDDNFDKNKFSPAAPGNGAFIIKNSWGTSWGAQGYFYISYNDSSLGYGDLAIFTTPQGTGYYGRLYSYDPFGSVGNIGLNGSNTAWFSNIFTALGNDRIEAVSFYNSAMNSPYEIYVYKDLANASNPRSGTLVSTKTGTLADAGYLTIPLTTQANISSGHLFSIVVKLTTPNYNYPIPIESAYSGYTSEATAAPGQSFFGSNGTSWTDAITWNSTMNVCLKAYASGKSAPGDFDGDSKTDIAAWRPDTGEWWIRMSSSDSTKMVPFGIAGDKLVPGDYDGDSKTDEAVWRPTDGTWHIINSATNTQLSVPWGTTGDIPVPGDYDGDGKIDVAVWRPSDGTWYLFYSSSNTVGSVQWGTNGDVPVPGDYDGDGKTDAAVWRESNGTWYSLHSSTNAPVTVQWGTAGDLLVPGDYDGDGKTDSAVWRPTNGTWYIIYSSSNTVGSVQWGTTGDIPVPGDYENIGKTEFAVWRPSNGYWHILNPNTNSPTSFQWGVSTDQPVKAGQPVR